VEWRISPAMRTGFYKGTLFKTLTIACVATALGGSYALDATVALRGYKHPGDVITVDQRPAFLAYVRRRQMLSDLDLKHVSVGDVLSDSGVKYYEIPLSYGAPFYRCAVIADEVVIVEPSTDRVIQVVD
jgi:hypothetical protein